MAGRILIIGALFLFIGSCRFDVDMSGFVYTPVPVKERFALSMQWNTDQPPREIYVEGDQYLIMAGSDAHVGGTDNLSEFVRSAVESGAAMIAVAGDIVTGWEDDYAIAAAELEGAGSIPLCMVPGNHDLYFNGWKSFYDYFGASVFTFTVHTTDTSDLYVFLDSGGGTLGGDQMQWLKELLSKERGDHRHVCVITHVNFFRNRFTLSTNPLNEEILTLLDLFAENRIDMVIQGHDHKRYEALFGNTTYITLDAMQDENEDASYLKLDVNSDRISHSFVTIN